MLERWIGWMLHHLLNQLSAGLCQECMISSKNFFIATFHLPNHLLRLLLMFVHQTAKHHFLPAKAQTFSTG